MSANESLALEHEQALVKAFILRPKQERFISLLANPKTRKKFTNELGHFRWFNPAFATAVPHKVDPKLSLWGRHLQGIDNIAQLLRSKGAGRNCWVISLKANIDRQEMALEQALEEMGSSMGTILSCTPGKLAYFDGEEETLLLYRH